MTARFVTVVCLLVALTVVGALLSHRFGLFAAVPCIVLAGFLGAMADDYLGAAR